MQQWRRPTKKLRYARLLAKKLHRTILVLILTLQLMFSKFGYCKGDRSIQRKYADRCTLLLNSTPSKLTFCLGLASLLFRGKQSTFVLVEQNFSFQVLELSLRVFDETLCMNQKAQHNAMYESLYTGTQETTCHPPLYNLLCVLNKHTIYSLLGITQILN